MQIIRSIESMRNYSNEQRKERRIGFVPTMGALHEGHLSLIKRAREENDIAIVSIFVNPTQFGKNEDFSKYPRHIDEDMKKCAGIDVLFHPEEKEMYPERQLAWVDVERLSSELCAVTRLGHFRAVATIVAKLLHIAKPHSAYFGQKDYQQFLIIEKMVRDLNMDVRIQMGATVRESDGLAMSSRNQYLNDAQRKEAAVLYRSLALAKKMIEQGETNPAPILNAMRKMIASTSGEIEYVEIRNAQNLEPIEDLTSGRALVALAVKFGKTRLIDNILIDLANA